MNERDLGPGDPRAWPGEPPDAVLLVDRVALVDLFATHPLTGAGARPRLAVVCIDGSPPLLVAWLRERFLTGWAAPVLYLHDAATVVYPFAIEPLATLVSSRGSVSSGGSLAAHASARPLAYVDLGLPPLGATARRFRDPSLPRERVVVELAALSPDALVRYCLDAAQRLIAQARPR